MLNIPEKAADKIQIITTSNRFYDINEELSQESIAKQHEQFLFKRIQEILAVDTPANEQSIAESLTNDSIMVQTIMQNGELINYNGINAVFKNHSKHYGVAHYVAKQLLRKFLALCCLSNDEYNKMRLAVHNCSERYIRDNPDSFEEEAIRLNSSAASPKHDGSQGLLSISGIFAVKKSDGDDLDLPKKDVLGYQGV